MWVYAPLYIWWTQLLTLEMGWKVTMLQITHPWLIHIQWEAYWRHNLISTTNTNCCLLMLTLSLINLFIFSFKGCSKLSWHCGLTYGKLLAQIGESGNDSCTDRGYCLLIVNTEPTNSVKYNLSPPPPPPPTHRNYTPRLFIESLFPSDSLHAMWAPLVHY